MIQDSVFHIARFWLQENFSLWQNNMYKSSREVEKTKVSVGSGIEGPV